MGVSDLYMHHFSFHTHKQPVVVRMGTFARVVVSLSGMEIGRAGERHDALPSYRASGGVVPFPFLRVFLKFLLDTEEKYRIGIQVD